MEKIVLILNLPFFRWSTMPATAGTTWEAALRAWGWIVLIASVATLEAGLIAARRPSTVTSWLSTPLKERRPLPQAASSPALRRSLMPLMPALHWKIRLEFAGRAPGAIAESLPLMEGMAKRPFVSLWTYSNIIRYIYPWQVRWSRPCWPGCMQGDGWPWWRGQAR